jgi:hypothetical protein
MNRFRLLRRVRFAAPAAAALTLGLAAFGPAIGPATYGLAAFSPSARDSIGVATLPDTAASDSARTPAAAALPEWARIAENRAFSAGETLVFEVAYGMVTAGIATMSIPDTQWVRGRPCFHIVTTAETRPFFSTFFKVRDRIESLVDCQGLFSWRYEKHLREGRYTSDRYEIYDPPKRRVFFKHDTVAAPRFVMDILAAFYYTRTVPLPVGGSVDVDCFGDGKVYPLKVLVHRKETVKVPAGRFSCIVVEPVIRGEGIFNQKGKLTIWLTDDDRRVPVLMRSKVLIGSIECRLKKYERP